MHQFGGRYDISAIHMADCLMAKTHPEQRCSVRGESLDRVADDPADLGPTGPRRQEYTVWRQRNRLINADLIVAYNGRLGTQFAEILDEVVDETVVAIDHEHALHIHSMAGTGKATPLVLNDQRAKSSMLLR